MSEPDRVVTAGALLISPDNGMVAELTRLLARELPITRVSGARAYPSRTALAEMFAKGMPQFCLLDVTSDESAASAALALLTSNFPELPVIALLHKDAPDVILRCMRQGAIGFLAQPFTAEQVRASLAKVARLQPRPTYAQSEGHIYCVMPAKGACGATTLACNLVYALRRLRSKKTLLADLDGLTGTVAFLIKLKSAYSFVDALTHSSTLDSELWKALVTPAGGLDVLLSPENPVDMIGETGDPAPLLAFTRQTYEVATVDVGGAYGEWNLAVARMSDDLLLVTTNELPALHASQRVLAYLEDNGVDREKIRLIVNRYQEDVGVPRGDIATALGVDVFETLPHDFDALQQALMEGKPAPPGSRFGKGVAALAQHLCGGGGTPAKKSSMFSGLFSRFGGR